MDLTILVFYTISADFGTLMMLFGEIVPAPRPLRPIRMERKKVKNRKIIFSLN
jgi:hypothetical protein